MDRQLAVWCPDLLEQQEQGREARAFDRVVRTVSDFSPRVQRVGPGVCSLPTRGPSRYFGGDGALAAKVAAALVGFEGPRAEGPGLRAGVGVADGLFAAVLAASRSCGPAAQQPPTVVAPGETPKFLSSFSVGVLGRPELGELLERLGLRTLGEFGQLPGRQVLARFGADGALCHAVARGERGELPGLRIEPTGPCAQHRSRSRRTRQPGFFGSDAEGEARAEASIEAVKHLLHPEAVVVGKLQGGRGPSDTARLVPWQASGPTARGGTGPPGAPWPGRVPLPSPVVVFADQPPAEVVDDEGQPVVVAASGEASSSPARLSTKGGPWREISAWSGPWPTDERWWSSDSRQRQARMQVVTSDGTAYLLLRRGSWWVEGVYD